MARGYKTGGKKKGYKAPQTLSKLMAREFVRQTVTDALAPMLRAQIAHAQGIGHLYTRDKAGKFTKVEDQEKVDELLATGEKGEDYWIFTKDPSVQAFSDLLNRALDRPKEQEYEVTITTSDPRIARLTAARKRLTTGSSDAH